MSTSTVVKTDTKTLIKPVTLWRVILLNDDYTPMNFVEAVLVQLFAKSMDEATTIALNIHETGRGVAGIYSQEICNQKARETCEVAKLNGHPLKAVAEPA